MKLQIDTKEKSIKIEETVNLGELFEKLKMLFPNDEWQEYNIMSTVINNWSNPIIIKEPYYPFVPSPIYPTVPYPQYPTCPQLPYEPFYGWPTITCKSELNRDVYNVLC